MILDDASARAGSPFSGDAYFRQWGARSVLCLPLAKHGELIGLLYLENNRAPNAFTPSRLAVLRFLAAQAAVSIENARLYATHRRDEQALRASETRFRSFVDHATDAFFLHDERGIVLDANREACESLGYTRDELIGLSPLDYNPDIDQAFLDRTSERLAVSDVVSFESRHRRKDGTTFLVEVRTRAFHADGHRLFIALVRDITERRRAECRLLAQHAVARTLAESATLEEATPRILRTVCELLDWDLGALWRVDDEAGVLRCAEVWHGGSVRAPEFVAATRAATFAPGRALPGRVWSTRTPACVPDVAAVADASFLRAPVAAREGLHAAFAFPVLLGDEVLGVIDFVSREVRQADQDLLDMMASVGSQIGQFIDRKRAEAALHHAQAELARAARVTTMGELAASLAHEIKQPITAAVANAGACALWLEGDAPDLGEARDAAERMVGDVRRVADLIDRVRSFYTRGAQRHERLDVNDLAREMVVLMQREADRHAVAIRTDLADDLPGVVGDRVQLQQVLMNLMLNGIEAMRDAPGELTVRTRRTDDGRPLVAVADQGVGLPTDQGDRIFEAFFTTKALGIGMGLRISRGIVEAHGGRLWASANVPRGATLQFTMPAGSTAGASDDRSTPSSAQSASRTEGLIG